VSTAWEDVQITKGMMNEVDSTAQDLGFTPDWRVDTGTAALLMGTAEAQLEQQILQQQLDTVKVKAHTTDHELASAIRAALGDTQLDQNGREIPKAPPRVTGKPHRLTSYRWRPKVATNRFLLRRRKTTIPPTSVTTCRTICRRRRWLG
jgi:hypothetical protein